MMQVSLALHEATPLTQCQGRAMKALLSSKSELHFGRKAYARVKATELLTCGRDRGRADNLRRPLNGLRGEGCLHLRQGKLNQRR